jgi:hypothetical protein
MSEAKAYKAGLENNFQEVKPKTQQEMQWVLDAVHDYRTDVQGWVMNPITGALEVNIGGVNAQEFPRIQLMMKHGKTHIARTQLEMILSQSWQGNAPTMADASHIFELLDPAIVTR